MADSAGEGGGRDRSGLIRLADARVRIPGPAGEHAVSLLERGTLKVKLSCPVRPNQQSPHAQDEVYVLARGRGVLVHGGQRDECGEGDLTVWVVFYGPDGGEVPAGA